MEANEARFLSQTQVTPRHLWVPASGATSSLAALRGHRVPGLPSWHVCSGGRQSFRAGTPISCSRSPVPQLMGCFTPTVSMAKGPEAETFLEYKPENSWKQASEPQLPTLGAQSRAPSGSRFGVLLLRLLKGSVPLSDRRPLGPSGAGRVSGSLGPAWPRSSVVCPELRRVQTAGSPVFSLLQSTGLPCLELLHFQTSFSSPEAASGVGVPESHPLCTCHLGHRCPPSRHNRVARLPCQPPSGPRIRWQRSGAARMPVGPFPLPPLLFPARGWRLQLWVDGAWALGPGSPAHKGQDVRSEMVTSLPPP